MFYDVKAINLSTFEHFKAIVCLSTYILGHLKYRQLLTIQSKETLK